MKNILFLAALSVFWQFTHSGCAPVPGSTNPPHYDLTKPAIYKMPSALDEISGIALSQGDPRVIYAEQDEDGKLYLLHWGDQNITHSKFGGHGDYEDVAICHNTVIMLRSDGVFFTYPLNKVGNKDIDGVQEQANLLPQGEFESLFADEQTNTLYVLCKNCAADKPRGVSGGFIGKIATDGQLSFQSTFTLDDAPVAKLLGREKIKLRPSAMARHPLTRQWYILSAVNKILLITDADWKPLGVYALSIPAFTQPEGIAFDKDANLYISNEKGGGETGSILKFLYQKN